MKYRLYALITLLFVSAMPIAEGREPLTIAVSANARQAMEAVTDDFTRGTGIPVEIASGSSGKLTAQIKAGAPFALFVSADMDFAEQLHAEGFSQKSPAAYAFGSLVLWTRGETDISGGLPSLLSETVRKIAVANPETAPYGRAAVTALKNAGIFEKIKHKLVFGESIAQVDHFVFSKAAEAGITARSSVMAPAMKGVGRWIAVDETLYRPIAQGLVVLKYGKQKNPQEAEQLYNFILSRKGKTILQKYGYRTEP